MKKLLTIISIAMAAIGVQAQDAGVDSVTSPATSCGLLPVHPITVTVKNFTAVAVPANTILMGYTINGATAVVDTLDVVLPASGTVSFTYTVKANLSPNEINYNIKAYTSWGSDVDNTNDTSVTNAYNYGPSLGGIAATAQTVCIGTAADTISLSGQRGTVVGWFWGIDGVTFPNFDAGSDTFKAPGLLPTTTYYKAVVKNGFCPFANSTVVKIQVDSATVGGTATGGGAVCDNLNSGTVTLTGQVGTVLRWESSAAGSPPWTNLGGAGSNTTNYSNIGTGDDLIFRAIVKVGVCPIDSSDTTAFSLDPVSVGGTLGHTGDNPGCAGSNNGTLTLSGHTGTVSDWEASILGGSFNSVGGAGSTTFNVTNILATTTYRAVVKSGSCPPIFSTTFTINIDSSTIGGTINSNATVCTGANGGSLNLINHRGDQLQWQKSTNGGGTWSNTGAGDTTTSYTYNNLVTTTHFRVLVQNGVCSPIPSAAAIITVNSLSVGGTISTTDPITVCAANNTGTLDYAGGNGTVTGWESSTNGGTSWTPIANLTTQHTYTNILLTTMFRVKVQNAPCSLVYSDTMTITVLPNSIAGSISGSSPVCSGNTVALTLSGSSGIIVIWRRSTNGGTSYSNIPGSAGQTSISPTITTNTLYNAVVQQGSCDEDTTVDFSVTVDPQTSGGTVTNNATVCGGNNSGTLTLAGSVGSIIDWIQSVNGGASWTSVPGPPNTTTNLNYSNLTQTTMYKVRVKSGVCDEDSSGTVTITVIPAAVGGTAAIVSPDDTLCVSTVIMTTTLTGHTGSVVQWQFSVNGGTTYSPVPGASASATTAFNFSFTTNTLFRALVQNGAICDTIPSTPALVVIDQPTVGGIATGSATVCGGSNNGFVTVSGHTGSVLNWEFSTNSGGTWTPIASSANTSYNYVGLNQDTWFRAVVKNGKCTSDVSDTAVITIIPAAIGGAVNYAGSNVCSGSMDPFTLNLTGSSGLVLRWQKSLNGSSWTNVANTTTSLTDSNITQTTHYRAVLQSGACPSVNSIPDTVFVDPISDAGTVNGSAIVCDTGNSGNIFITGYTGNVLNWRTQKDGTGFSNVAGSAGEDTISYNNLTAGVHEFKAVVKSGVCVNDTSLVATITVDPDVVAGTLAGGAAYCDPNNSTLLQLTGYTGTIQTWQQSTNGGTSWNNISGTGNRDTVTFKNIVSPTMYRVIVTSGACGTDTSNVQSIDVGQSIAGTLNQSDSVCISGHSNLLQLIGYTGTITGWQDSVTGGAWGSVFNGGFDTLRYTNLLQTTSYRVIVKSGICDPDTSNMVVIHVSDTVFAGTLSQNLSFCDTTNSDTLLLSGYFGPIENWFKAVNGGPWTPFSPVKTDSAYIFNNLKDSITEFRVIMKGGVCGSDTSNIVNVQVGATLAGILMSDDTVCSGNNQGVIRLLGYRGVILGWDSTDTAGVFFPMTHMADSLVYVDLNDTITYRVRVQNPGCPVDTSNEVTIVTVPGTTSGILTGTRSLCDTTNMDSVILVGRVGSILIWESSINMGTTWDTILGQTTDTLIYTNLKQTTWYRVMVQGAGLCPDDTSNIAIIQIGPSNAGIISGDTQLCAGSIANLFLTGHNGDVVVWETSIDAGMNWNPIPQSDTSVINFPIGITSIFRAIVQSDTCTADTSAIYQILVDQPYNGTLIAITQLCYGVGSDTIALSNPVDTVFDWEIRADNIPGFSTLNNTDTFQTYDTLKITTHYRVFVKNGVCPVDTVSITLTVDTFTIAGFITGDDTVCSGNNGGLILLQGHIGNTFTWQASTDGGQNYIPAPGAVNDTFYVYNNLTDTTTYRVIVASGGCPADTTNTVVIVVKPAAIGGIVLADTSFCKGPNGGVLNLTGYFGDINGWQESIGGGGFTTITPANTTDSLIYNNIDTTTTYRVLLSFGDCPDDTSVSATITILKTPITAITANGPTEFCIGDSVNLTASGGPDYTWSTSDTVATIEVKSSGIYTVVVTEATTGCTDADSMQVTVFALPVIDAGADQTIELGESAQLEATGGTTYEWTPKTGLDDGFISDPVATPIDTIIYIVVSQDDNGCEGIDTVVVFVTEPPDSTDAPTFTNLFTPNGDGHNDTWKITSKANCTQCKLAVYNRYGQEVYTDENYKDDWEGTFKGKKLPDGTYYYVVSTETGKIFKGAITILRGE